MVGLSGLYSSIRGDLEAVQAAFRAELVSDQPFIQQLFEHTEQYHGKLIRPALLLLCAQACGGVRSAHHVLGAVVEMVHIATLVHDDVLDHADLRRRSATVNRLCGNERAVLLGDVLFSHAYHLCAGLESQLAARVIGATAVTLCEGEMMQVVNRGNFALSEAAYLDIIERKTGSLIGASALLGARYAGADEARARAFREFGLNLGIAFQIADDLLDVTGSEARVGKSVGRDVETGKLTLPLIHYLREQDSAARAEMLALLGGEAADRDRRIAERLADSDSLAYATDMAAAYVQRALAGLTDLPASDGLASLRAMAAFVIDRDH